jgi:hypothetical protein
MILAAGYVMMSDGGVVSVGDPGCGGLDEGGLGDGLGVGGGAGDGAGGVGGAVEVGTDGCCSTTVAV